MARQIFIIPDKLQMAMKLYCVKNRISIASYIIKLITDDLIKREEYSEE